MTDCPNAEMRDRLPDLLHERLEASARAVVIAHIGECADCRAELALLREVRISLSSNVIAMDTAAVARTVLARSAAGGGAARRRIQWTDWRLAAAVAVLVVGGASFATEYGRHLLHNARRVAATEVTATVSPPVDTVTSRRVPASTPISPRSETAKPHAELAATGDVSDLSEGELRTLLGDLDTIEAVPPTEPEPVAVRVSLPDPGGTE